jgi:hypothetical protein
MPHKELPRDIVQSIQRILELQDPDDPLEELGDFDSVKVLNKLFPDGPCHETVTPCARLAQPDVFQRSLLLN